MAYRNDLEAVASRAAAAERELKRVQDERATDQQKFTALQVRLEESERAVVRANASSDSSTTPSARSGARAAVRDFERRLLAQLGFLGAGIGATAWIGHPLALAGGVAGLAALVGLRALARRAHAHREVVVEFLGHLRDGKYLSAVGLVSKLSRSPKAFSRFCTGVEQLRLVFDGLVTIRGDRYLRPGEAMVFGTVRGADGRFPLEATVTRDKEGVWRIVTVTIKATPPIVLDAKEDDAE